MSIVTVPLVGDELAKKIVFPLLVPYIATVPPDGGRKLVGEIFTTTGITLFIQTYVVDELTPFMEAIVVVVTSPFI
jgi:hypothetical protein